MDFWILFSLAIFVAQIINMYINNKYVSQVILLILLIIGGFRYRIGFDYDHYVELFYMVQTDNIAIEKSFASICIFLRENGFDYQTMFLIYEIGILFFLYLGARYYVKNNSMFWALYACLPLGFMYSMGIIRQALAVAIVFYATRYIKERKLFKYFLGIMIAALFHKSAIICIFLYALAHKEYHMKYHIVCVTVMAIAAYLNIFSDICLYILESLGLGYTHYILNGVGYKPGLGNVLFYVFSWLLIIISNKYSSKNHRLNPLVINMITINVCVLFFFSFSYEMIRIQNYFSIFIIVALVQIVANISIKNIQLFVASTFLILSICWLYTFLNHTANNRDGIVAGGSGNNIEYEFNFRLMR